jgi:Ca2+-binding EF-hand superfamily protein
MRVLEKENFRKTEIMVAIMRYQIELDSKLDNIKRRLANTNDFNLQDAFRIFDSEGKGFVSSLELWQGLTMLEVSATT